MLSLLPLLLALALTVGLEFTLRASERKEVPKPVALIVGYLLHRQGYKVRFNGTGISYAKENCFVKKLVAQTALRKSVRKLQTAVATIAIGGAAAMPFIG